MKLFIKYLIIIVLSALFVYIISYYAVKWNKEEISRIQTEEDKKVILLPFESINYQVKFVPKAWGVSGNHSNISVIINSINKNDASTSILSKFDFNTTHLFYKKVGGDSLVIYSSEKINEESLDTLNTKLKINFHKIDKHDEFMLLIEKHDSLNLEMVSIYK